MPETPKSTVRCIGQVYGRLTVIAVTRENWKTKLECICSCGKRCRVASHKVISGHTTSCGCRLQEVKDSKYKHGKSTTKTYGVWKGMKARCLNPNNKKYIIYGGRGITVCDKWLSFEGFLEDMGEKPAGLTLERVDSNKGYCKENCKWASYTEQARNTSQNSYLTFKGETLRIIEWAERLGWDRSIIQSRIQYGWSVKKILTTPVRQRSPNGYRKINGKVSPVRSRNEEGNNRISCAQTVHRGASDSGMRERDDDFIL